jgi:hypothetical protein
MSDIDLIREAAALMRQRAEWANEGPWERGRDWAGTYTIDADSIGTLGQGFVGTDAIHIASWHPTVALAVADWLSDIATRHEPDPEPLDLMLHYDSDEECAECEQGNGHSSIVCKGCHRSSRRTRRQPRTSARSTRNTPRASACSLARWTTGPSAIGSENGTPNSMASAPAATIACMIGTVSSRPG